MPSAIGTASRSRRSAGADGALRRGRLGRRRVLGVRLRADVADQPRLEPGRDVVGRRRVGLAAGQARPARPRRSGYEVLFAALELDVGPTAFWPLTGFGPSRCQSFRSSPWLLRTLPIAWSMLSSPPPAGAAVAAAAGAVRAGTSTPFAPAAAWAALSASRVLAVGVEVVNGGRQLRRRHGLEVPQLPARASARRARVADRLGRATDALPAPALELRDEASVGVVDRRVLPPDLAGLDERGLPDALAVAVLVLDPDQLPERVDRSPFWL